MAVIERRRIGELVARYGLEPSLRDVFVEGPSDRAFFSWFLRSHGLRDAAVFEIEQIDIPAETIIKYGLRPGRRGAVIALAMELHNIFGYSPLQATCVADRDGDEVSPYAELEMLQFTDFAALESYFFDVRIADKLLTVAAGRSDVRVDVLLEQFVPVLVKLFAMREANLALDLQLEWLSFDRCCDLRDGRVLFDADDFIRRYLNKSAKLFELNRFIGEVERQLSNCPLDPRMRINGHDFVTLLTWYLRTSRIKPKARLEEIGELLATSAEASWLDDYPLFKNLMTRVT